MSAPPTDDGPALLLIGAGGFVGSHLEDAALAAGIPVTPATRSSEQGQRCDLLDPDSIEGCLEAVRPDLIVNAAGSPSVAASWERPGEAFAVNALGVLNLLEAVSRVTPEAHLLCLSSAAVYGEPEAAAMPLGEAAPVEPVSPYGAAKAAMELLCAQYGRSRGLRIAVARAFNLIGPGQPPFNAASGLARQIALAEIDGEASVELALGNPAAARDLIDVRDAARGLVEISRRRLAGTYNLCSGRAVSVAGLAGELAAATPLEVGTHVDPQLARPADPQLLLGDPDRIREATGFAAETPLAQSLADLLDWWRLRLAAANPS